MCNAPLRSISLLRLPALLPPLVLVGAGCSSAALDRAPVEDENSVTIRAFSPKGETETHPIEIRFSKDIVGPEDVGRPATERYLEITPPVPGEYAWKEASLLTFVPQALYRPNTRYRVRVREVATGRYRLLGPAEYEFSTALFRLQSVTPFFEGVDPAISIMANLEFSHPVDPDAVSSVVRFEDALGRPVAATRLSTKPDQVMAFRLDRSLRLEEARDVKVLVAGTLRPVIGGEAMGADAVRSIAYAARPALQVGLVSARAVSGGIGIEIRFSSVVDEASTKGPISVDPAIPFRVALASSRELDLIGDFKPGRTYTITVGKGFGSEQGGFLEASTQHVVTVPDLQRQLRFDNDGSYLMRNGAQSFTVETVNVDKLLIRVDKVFENNLRHVLPDLHARRYEPCWNDGCDEGGFQEYGEDGDYDGDYGADVNSPRRYELRSVGRPVFTGEIDVASTRNEWVSTTIPFREIDEDRRRGLYRVRLSDKEQPWRSAEKWMLATDLGLTAKVGGGEVSTQVVSLSTLRPISGVEVAFISRSNQVIGTARTNAEGIAKAGLSALEPDEPLSLVTARRGEDFSYLSLAGTEIATADFDVGGDSASGSDGDKDRAAPYEAYVYADRGIYRPGDKAHVTVLVRDVALSTPPAFPYKLEVRTPKWVLFDTRRGTTKADGAEAFTFEFPSDALTGDYSLRVLTPDGKGTLGRLTLKVEDFMPDRIKVDVTPAEATGVLGEPAQFELASAYLFGPLAAGLPYSAQCVFEEIVVRTKENASFEFGADDPYRGRTNLNYVEALGEAELDDEGKASVACALNVAGDGDGDGDGNGNGNGNEANGGDVEGGGRTTAMPRRPVRVRVVATVSERGGRSVTGSGSMILHAHPYYVGVRRSSKQAYAEAGEDAGLEVMAVDQNGKPKAGAVIEAAFYAVEWKTVLKLASGRYRYVSERADRLLGAAKVTTSTHPVALPFVPTSPGEIRVEIKSGSTATRSTMNFWVNGSGYAAWEMNKPDQLGLVLDKVDYAPGEIAKVMIRAPFSGTVYVTVERDRVLSTRRLELAGNGGNVLVPITAEMAPNVYVSAELIRSPKSVEKQAPMRAFGVIPLAVRSERHRLGVRIEAPPEIRPNTTVDVKVKVSGARGSARVTLTAVDEGILRITDFDTPDPFAFFTRKRRLGVTTYDMFDLLLPEVRKKATSILRGGGGDEEVRRKHLNPVSVKRVKPLALWSGLVSVAADGTATVRLEVPEFQGVVRLMAVAFERERFGAAAKTMHVRDPIVLTPTLPRFLAPLDEVEVPVEVFNGTGETADIEVKATIEGRLEIRGKKSQTIKLKKDGMGLLHFQLAADEVVGRAKIVLVGTAVAAGGDLGTASSLVPRVVPGVVLARTRSRTELTIRPANAVTTDGLSKAADSSAPLRFKVPGGYLEGSMKTRVTVGPLPAAQFGRSLRYLLDYPYGCAEQTTSRAFPLLYLRDLAKMSADARDDLNGVDVDVDVDVYVNAGIARLVSMVSPQGGLSYWPGGSFGYAWSTIYGTHFLVEAQKAGFEVDAPTLDGLLSHLNQMANGLSFTSYGRSGPELRDRAYALYVLALAGRSNQNALHYAASEGLEPMTTEGVTPSSAKRPLVDAETQNLLAGALLLSGKTAQGEAHLARDVALEEVKPRDGFWSQTRADALMLSILADVAPHHPSVMTRMKRLMSRANSGRWGTTQENAYALMALGKMGRQLFGRPYRGSISINDEPLAAFDSERSQVVAHEGADWVGKEVEVKIVGDGTAFVGIEVEGIRAGLLEPKASGIEVARSFMDLEGQAIDLEGVRQGDLVVVRIEVSTPVLSGVENVAVVDMLPAGFEVENPRLSNENVLPWMSDVSRSDYVDIRDDRLMFFTSLRGRSTSIFYYTARAITKGRFALPHVHAEAMYDPSVQAYSGGGRLIVE